MVLKKVKWTYFDAYLCQTMWNNAKKSMKRLKRPNSLFLQGEVSSAVLKTWKTRETKTRITQNFQILNHIQGTTIGKLTSWGFRKCGSFCPGEFLKRSYWLSKSSNFSIFFKSKMRCQKKRHGHNFDFSGLKRIAGLVHPISYPTYSFQPRKIKIVAVSFFCDAAFCFRKKLKNY